MQKRKTNNIKSIIAWAMVLCLVIFVGVTVGLGAAHSHSGCSGEDCLVCSHLYRALGSLGLVVLGFAGARTVWVACRQMALCRAGALPGLLLVGHKVRLNR